MKLSNIKKYVGCYVKPPIRMIKSGTERRRMKYAYLYKYEKIDNRMIMYESFFGRGMLDNPYAIFLYLLENEKSIEYTHIWVLDDVKNHQTLIKEWSTKKNIIFVSRHSLDYLRYLCKAKYLINNVTFPSYFSKKPNQVYVNTWHGIPIKTLGYDMPNGKTEVTNVVRNFFHVDYLLSTGPFLTECFFSAYKLKGIYRGCIVEEGYPRLDTLKRYSRSEVVSLLRKQGVRFDPSRKVILYAPTWRGISYAEADSDVDEYYHFKEELEKRIDTSEYQLLIKVHPRVYELAKDKLNTDYFVPATVDANIVLSVVDILISDFSSIYFDFLPTGKPILFYINDLESYKQQRGLYRDLSGLPGPVSDSLVEVAKWINGIDEVQEAFREKYSIELKESGGVDAGRITERIVDIVFNGHKDGYRIVKDDHKKKSILFSRGRMLANGITTSFLNLLDTIDYTEFDVSAMVYYGGQPIEYDLLQKINPNVRVLYRNSTHNMTLPELISHEKIMQYGCENPYLEMYSREWRRFYGEVEFDYIIDFEGYNNYYSLLALQQKVAKSFIWLHNDMMAEYRDKFPYLMNIFRRYKYFSRVVACGREAMDENKKNLVPEFIEDGKLGYASNLIGINHIKECLAKDEIKNCDGKVFIQTDIYDDNDDKTSELNVVPYIQAEIDGKRTFRFMTIGRLSPEKNHRNLIKGFSRFQKEYKQSFLYILGEGPEREALEALIEKRGLGEHVFLTGIVENPFAIMKNCDCFILPSLHEGQPMVINEARMAGLPIILSDFTSVKGVMIEDGQLLIGHTAKEIYKGLKAFSEGKVPNSYHFDAMEYNERAYSEFKHAIGAYKDA